MESVTLSQVENFPNKLLEVSANKLYTIFPQPTILHLQGKKPEPLFISILQNGNETTGLKKKKKLLNKYKDVTPPRSTSIFFGNSQAARYGKRVLDHQPDYNRVWPSTTEPFCQETEIMKRIVEEMKQRRVFASIDIHNNTGLNPYYACINKLDNQFIQLAALFGHMVVYFLTPKGVQSLAFSELCPSVTVECGKPDSHGNVDRVFDYVDTILHMNDIKNDPVSPYNIDLFHTVARVVIPANTSFSFTDHNAEILLKEGLDKMNFSETPADTCFGVVQSGSKAKFMAFNENDIEVTENYFYMNEKKIRTSKPVMPAMLTMDETIIRQDCLCYLMERIHSK